MNKANTAIFLDAARGRPTPHTPIWFMRQAGRYQPEYRKLRERYSMFELCMSADLITKITLLPVEQFTFDAAILFSDIMLPLKPMGAVFDYVKGKGPIFDRPLRDMSNVETLRPLEPQDDLPFVLEAIGLIRRELPENIPLIGFAAAPFTLGSYLIEGGPSRSFLNTKKLMYRSPAIWHRLATLLSEMTLEYLRAQIQAGAQAVQLFDSWVGCLGPEDYEEFVLPYTERIFAGLRGTGAPTIHFGTCTASLLPIMKQAGGDVLGVDWRLPLDVAWKRLQHETAIQGNLEPAVLLGPWERIEEKVRHILRQAAGRPGHIFNLGHGILPETPTDHVKAVVDLVHEETSKHV